MYAHTFDCAKHLSWQWQFLLRSLKQTLEFPVRINSCLRAEGALSCSASLAAQLSVPWGESE